MISDLQAPDRYEEILCCPHHKIYNTTFEKLSNLSSATLANLCQITTPLIQSQSFIIWQKSWFSKSLLKEKNGTREVGSRQCPLDGEYELTTSVLESEKGHKGRGELVSQNLPDIQLPTYCCFSSGLSTTIIGPWQCRKHKENADWMTCCWARHLCCRVKIHAKVYLLRGFV